MLKMRKYINKVKGFFSKKKKSVQGITIEEVIKTCMYNGSPMAAAICIVNHPVTKEEIYIRVDILCSIIDKLPLQKEGNVIQFPKNPKTPTEETVH